MSILTELRAFLLADATINGIVGTGDSARVFSDRAPQGVTGTFIVLQRIDTIHEETLNERSAGLARSEIEVTTSAVKRTDAETLAEAIRQHLQGYTGAMGALTIQNTLLLRDSDDYQPDPERFQTEQDFEFWYAESVPT